MFAGTLWLFLFSSSNGFYFVLVCLAGVVIGPLLFFNGFRMLRYKRMILNTPLSKIHSASIGLVEVMGTPVGPKTLAAPVTGDPCYYYQVQAWQWQGSDNKHYWNQVLNESLYLPFFLEDSTGRVLIDPQGAEMDVHKSFSDEIGATYFNTRDLLPENIRNFLVKRGLVPYDKIKVEERIIQRGYPLFVFGTLGDNPSQDSWAPRPHLAGSGASTFDIQLSDGPGFGITLRRTTMSTKARPLNTAVVNTLGYMPGTQVVRLDMKAPDAGGQPVTSGGAGAATDGTGSSLLARVLSQPPGGVAVIDNNAPENSPSPSFDLHPSAAISKGKRNDPFTISWHSQKEVVQSLAWKSTLYVWGGPVVAIACFYFLLLYWGFISL